MLPLLYSDGPHNFNNFNNVLEYSQVIPSKRGDEVPGLVVFRATGEDDNCLKD